MSQPWSAAVGDAACAEVGLGLFYGPDDPDEPDGYREPVDQRQWRERRAIQICEDCPIRADCLVDELTYPARDQHGVRGGMTARARQRLLARWRKNGLIPEHRATGDHALVANLLAAEGRSAS